MAESIVSDLVGRLLGYLSKSAAKEVACYFGGRKKLNKLEQTMRMIQARLLDAERLREEDDGALIKSWLKRLKQVLYRLEDLFDEVSMADTQKHPLVGGKVVSKPVRYLNSKFSVLTLNRKVAKSVEAIMGELEAITSEWIDQLIQLPKLRALPQSLGHLTALQKLEIFGCPELKQRCQQPDGEDWPLIQHIPSVDL